MVTTPNVEYNRVLHALGGSVLENGLRNSDHRFEWWVSWCLASHVMPADLQRPMRP